MPIRIALWLALAFGVGFPAPAVADGRERVMLDDAQAEVFRGVGRLNVAGRRFCTAALVSETQVVTAAHCLYHPRTRAPVPLSEIRFVAGQRRDEQAAVRGVVRAAVPPDFVFDGAAGFEAVRRDIALVEMDAPVTPEDAPAFRAGPAPGPDAVIEVVSYARDRAQAASMQDGCRIRAVVAEVVALDCGVNLGASGAPVLTAGKTGREIWGVVSATGTLGDGGAVTLAVRVEPELPALVAGLAAEVRDAGTPVVLPPPARP